MRRIARIERIHSTCIRAAYPYRAEERPIAKGQQQKQQQRLSETPSGRYGTRSHITARGASQRCFQRQLLLLLQLISFFVLGCCSWLLLFRGLAGVRCSDCCGADPLYPPNPPNPRPSCHSIEAGPSGCYPPRGACPSGRSPQWGTILGASYQIALALG